MVRATRKAANIYESAASFHRAALLEAVSPPNRKARCPMALLDFLRSGLERELYRDRAELDRILRTDDARLRYEALMRLAMDLGATRFSIYGRGTASEAEVTNVIHVALQTKAMIATVSTTSNYVIVTIILAVLAFGSMIAIWVR